MTARALRLPPMHPESRLPVFGALGVTVLGLVTGIDVLTVLGGFVAGIGWLGSRMPLRASPQDPRLVLAPVDGIVEAVEDNTGIPSELGLSGQATKITISSAPWSAASIRAPGAGRLTSRVERPGGKYVVATDSDDPTLSRVYLRIETEIGTVGLVFSSGGFAPRTLLDAAEGSSLDLGAVIGHRRFGGWCDVYVQGDMTVEATPGQTMLAGETVLAVAGHAERPNILIR